MKEIAFNRWFLLAVALGVLAFGGAAVLASGGAEPGQPPWVAADGTVDRSLFPEAVEVAGPEGKPVTCANGKRLKVPRSMLVGPPPDGPGELRRQGSPEGATYVYRCGSGPNPDRNPVRVRAGS